MARNVGSTAQHPRHVTRIDPDRARGRAAIKRAAGQSSRPPLVRLTANPDLRERRSNFISGQRPCAVVIQQPGLHRCLDHAAACEWGRESQPSSPTSSATTPPQISGRPDWGDLVVGQSTGCDEAGGQILDVTTLPGVGAPDLDEADTSDHATREDDPVLPPSHVDGVPAGKPEPLRSEYEAFSDAVAGREAHIVTTREGRRSPQHEPRRLGQHHLGLVPSSGEV